MLYILPLIVWEWIKSIRRDKAYTIFGGVIEMLKNSCVKIAKKHAYVTYVTVAQNSIENDTHLLTLLFCSAYVL